MASRRRNSPAKRKQGALKTKIAKTSVDSLLDAMEDGREYASLVDLVPNNINFRDEFRRAIFEVENVRQRPLLVYAANVVTQIPGAQISISVSDDLPFSEMVAAVPDDESAIDLLIVTPGGLGQQVSQFVDRTRPRFTECAFLLPHMTMSAGTIWALSGNEIWMDRRAFIGPIDPQVPSKDGRLLPAQALLALVEDIKERGEKNLKLGQNPPWTDVQILRNIDPKELGNALTLSQYSIQLAANYLENHKFRDWATHSNGKAVTPADRRERAIEVATKLCSHDVWKTHSHGISREVAWQELKIKIGHPESVPGLERAMRRLWALIYWAFENTAIAKIFLSQSYSLFRTLPGANR